MRGLFLTIAAGLAVATAASAQAPGPNDKATLCLDQLGINHAPVCRSQNASRFPTAPDICQCHGPYRQVDAPFCAPGETPAADTADFDHARIDYARKNKDSLFGFSFQGKRSCVVPGNGS